jgi:PLP dependent protein
VNDISRRLSTLAGRIDDAVARAGRRDGVTLVAVTKSVDVDRVRAAFEAGQKVFGENRVQEGMTKAAAVPEACWHLIGHLQTNKASRAVNTFSLIESVDSLHLAVKLNEFSKSRGNRLPVLFEVNLGGEASKHGFEVAQFWEQLPQLLALPDLLPKGLMTVAPMSEDPEETRPIFRELRETRDSVRNKYALEGFSELSMGMSHDFEVAIQEGATIVRIGRAIFGERSPAGTK